MIAERGSFTPPIAVLRGAPGPVLQQFMWACATRWAAAGARVHGVLERHDGSGQHTSDAVTLVDLASGVEFPVFQDLGSESTACHLDPSGIVAACAVICRTLEEGADLLILSKFGKLEAERSGLIDAFGAAIARGVPVLTAVAPAYSEAWAAFSAPLAADVALDGAALDEWWNRVSRNPARFSEL